MSRRLIYGFALALLLFPAEVPGVMAADPTQANGHQQPRVEKGQVGDPARLRELREKARSGSLTPEEQKELDAAMAARNGTRP